MNPKATREQNDISIIIGNLPQRLQKKFAENCSADVENGSWRPRVSKSALSNDSGKDKRNDVAARVGCPRGSSARSVPKISRDASPDLEASGSAHHNRATVAAASSNEVQNLCSVLPGVLRLNASTGIHSNVGGDAKEKHYSSVKREQAKKPRKQQQYAIESLTKEILPISPARLPLRLTVQPDWFKNLDDLPVVKDLPQLYESLTAIIRRNALMVEWDYFSEIHNEIRHIFTLLIFQHLKFVCEQKVDTFMWKLLFYNIRECLKSQSSAEARQLMLNIIDVGLEYYEMLYAKLKEKYTNTNSAAGEQAKKFEFMAKVAVQKILICLGDLSRYRAKQLQSADYSEATKYYEQAQTLIPTNAIPYNQLAIVALHARKQFDAVYFHMRSLMSSNAIYSAKESLLVLFDEMRKKYEDAEAKISPVRKPRTPNMRKNSYSRSMRKEIWIYPDGVRRLHRTDLNADDNEANTEEIHLKQLKVDELMKRFVSLYLFVIGKLYTGIGMETILTYQRNLFIHFSVVIQSSSSPLLIKRSRLLKFVALNIFLVEHNKQKESGREMRYHAINLANQMFGVIVHKCNKLFGQLDEILPSTEEMENNKATMADITSLLQYIRIYVKWLTLNVDMWEPLRSEEHAFIDCWAELQNLFDKIGLYCHAVKFEVSDDDDERIVYEEDIFLLGFTPLAITYNKHEIAPKPSDENIQFKHRLQDILQFESFLLEHQHQFEAAVNVISSPVADDKLKVELCSSFENLSDSDDIDGGGGTRKNFSDSHSSDDNSENIVINGDNIELKLSTPRNGVTKENAQITQLNKLKRELEAKSNVKKMYNAKLQEILNFVDMRLQIEVRPKYLLPDTNCFIDYLEDFERLVQQYKRYTLVIPLTVVKELDGLSKGVKIDTYEKFVQKHRIHHYDDVSSRAMKSLEFIKSAKSNVKCATTKGSYINASLFALVEEEHVSNDDKILATAMSLSKAMSNETSKDGKCLIRTELVLITTDRNLRVKALSRNLAVSELSEFLQWAKDCNKFSS